MAYAPMRRRCSRQSRRHSRFFAASVTLPAEAVAPRSLTSRDGTRIAYRAWPLANAKVTVAVAHGLGEHTGRYAEVAAAMATRGIATFAMDLRGHGHNARHRGHIAARRHGTHEN